MAVLINTTAGWTAANPTLADGDYGVQSDDGHYKLGDGATAWDDLEYYGLLNNFDLNEFVDLYNANLNCGIPFKSKSAGYDMNYYDGAILVTTGANEVIIKLPRPSLTDYSFNGVTYARRYNIQKVDSGVGKVKIIPFGTEKILGEDFHYLYNQYENLSTFSDTVNWFEI